MNLTLLYAEPTNLINKFLNQEEHQYLKNIKTPIRVGITHIPNQVLKNKREYSGFSIDIFKKIETLLDIKFKFIYFNTWNDLILAGKKRKIDILFAAQKTKSRLSYYDFTDIILKQHNKIIVADDRLTPLKIEDLFGKKVAVVKSSALSEYLKFNYPKIILIPNASELNALVMTAQKKPMQLYLKLYEPVIL